MSKLSDVLRGVFGEVREGKIDLRAAGAGVEEAVAEVSKKTLPRGYGGTPTQVRGMATSICAGLIQVRAGKMCDDYRRVDGQIEGVLAQADELEAAVADHYGR